MTIFKHEWRQGWKSFAIWTGAIGILVAICVLLYHEMKGDMGDMGEMFASMGAFSAAFGLDQLNFGTLVGYYSIECGNVLGLGGAFFAALIAIGALAKEEKDGTAEFLLAHPVSRVRIITEKLLAILSQIVALNVIVLLLALGSMVIIGEEIPWTEVLLIHVAYFLLQVELVGICFGISAFIRRGGLGIGLGIAIMMYFLNMVANLAESASFLRYITPYGYTEGADIINNASLEMPLVLLGMVWMLVGIAIAYVKYTRKDIHG